MDLTDFNDEIVITKIPFPDEASEGFEWEERRICDPTSITSRTAVPTVEINGGAYVPAPKDRLYFYQGCDIPRHKVRAWAKKNNASVTIKQENGTAYFGSSESLRLCFSTEYYCQMNASGFLAWMDANYDLGDGNLSELYDFIEKSNKNFVLLSSEFINYRGKEYTGCTGVSHKLDSNGNKIFSPYTDYEFSKPMHELDDRFIPYTYMTTVKQHRWDDIVALTNNPVIYTQESLIGLINEEAVIIDSTMFEDLRNMFKSTNQDDRVMALEIMANCNIDPSMHHVLLLLKQFGSVISNLKQSNHINFTSLIEYLDVENWEYDGYVTDETIIETMMKKDQLTYDVLKDIALGVKAGWNDSYKNKYLTVSKITVTDEIRQYFAKKEAEEKEKEAQAQEELAEQ